MYGDKVVIVFDNFSIKHHKEDKRYLFHKNNEVKNAIYTLFSNC